MRTPTSRTTSTSTSRSCGGSSSPIPRGRATSSRSRVSATGSSIRAAARLETILRRGSANPEHGLSSPGYRRSMATYARNSALCSIFRAPDGRRCRSRCSRSPRSASRPTGGCRGSSARSPPAFFGGAAGCARSARARELDAVRRSVDRLIVLAAAQLGDAPSLVRWRALELTAPAYRKASRARGRRGSSRCSIRSTLPGASPLRRPAARRSEDLLQLARQRGSPTIAGHRTRRAARAPAPARPGQPSLLRRVGASPAARDQARAGSARDVTVLDEQEVLEPSRPVRRHVVGRRDADRPDGGDAAAEDAGAPDLRVRPALVRRVRDRVGARRPRRRVGDRRASRVSDLDRGRGAARDRRPLVPADGSRLRDERRRVHRRPREPRHAAEPHGGGRAAHRLRPHRRRVDLRRHLRDHVVRAVARQPQGRAVARVPAADRARQPARRARVGAALRAPDVRLRHGGRHCSSSSGSSSSRRATRTTPSCRIRFRSAPAR